MGNILKFQIKKMATSAGATSKLISINFEVFGKVQGVFFRKYTQQEATKLKLAKQNAI